MRKLTMAAGIVALAMSATLAGAQTFRTPEFQGDFGLGYSRLRIDGPNAKGMDKDDGAAVHIGGTFAVPGTRGFRLGFGFEGSNYFDDFHVADTNGDLVHRYNEVTMIVPEFEIAYYLPIHHFFIEPKLGIGLAVADFSSGRVHHHHHHDDFDDEDDDGTFLRSDDDRVRLNAEIRPAIQIGYTRRNWAVGLEAAYLYTHLHFGQGLGGDVSELYAGAFVRWQF